jgi:glutamate--cysteine ligase
LYDPPSLDAAWDMVRDWSCEERAEMRAAVPTLAFNAPFRGRKVLDLAREMLEISQAGLRSRSSEDAGGMTEEGFLQPLNDLVGRGYTRAEELLRRWKTEWEGDFTRLMTEYNFL